MLPGRRDALGQLYGTAAAPGATSMLRGGIACTPLDQVHFIASGVPASYINGYGVTDTGQLVVENAGVPVSFQNGLARTANSCVAAAIDGTPVAGWNIENHNLTDPEGRLAITTVVPSPAPDVPPSPGPFPPP